MLVHVATCASDALGREAHVRVAILAFQRRVLSQQREARQFVIEAHIALPVAALVATATLRAELARMHVILLVTRSAFGRELELIGRARMAGFAFCQRVLSGEGKAGQRVMVEIDLLPAAFGVAAPAVLPATAFVRVLRLMAAETGCRRLHKLGRLLVAGLAGGLAMGALEREIGHPVMVEADLVPRTRRVAGFALGTVPALMGIVLRMTGEAAARGMFAGIARAVTSRARSCRVPADQRESRALVIERHRAPGRSRVTAGAIRAPAAAMDVVLRVAGDATLAEALPALPRMA